MTRYKLAVVGKVLGTKRIIRQDNYIPLLELEKALVCHTHFLKISLTCSYSFKNPTYDVRSCGSAQKIADVNLLLDYRPFAVLNSLMSLF